MTDLITVLLVEPEQAPRITQIGNDLTSMQAVVGGPIQAVYPFDQPVALICHEEGKLLGLPLNRALRDKNGSIYDVISGPFFLCSAPGDSNAFDGLSRQQLDRFDALFKNPELFVPFNGTLVCIPLLAD